MKPLKLTPAFKDYIWGGDRLRTIYGKKTCLSPVAESWELSCHKDGPSVICGGEHDGKSLDDYIKENPGILGTSVMGSELPILIKFIDAKESLSVQVHPDDEYAMKREGQNGKTEMWYVADADPGAYIVFGLNDDITKNELALAIKGQRLESLLNLVPSAKGEVFFVEAGTIHAIGKGNLIVEIQQNSNVTYRLYDYGRVGKDGKMRELHVEKGIEVSNCKKMPPRCRSNFSGDMRQLAQCKYFVVNEIKLNGTKNMNSSSESYHALVTVDGNFEISGADYVLTVNAGETVFVPAGIGAYSIIGDATVLFVSNP